MLLIYSNVIFLNDRIISYKIGQSATGLKNVTINEPFFQGHFPGFPVMPGVLQIEAMAQTAGALVMKEVEDQASQKIIG